MGLIVFIVILLMSLVGLAFMFEKAGRKKWEAFIPIYNTYIMCQIAEKPIWNFWIQFVPLLGLFYTFSILIDFVKTFNQTSMFHAVLTVIAGAIYFPYLGFSKDVRYVAQAYDRPGNKSAVREWTEAIVFAVVAATLIRTFLFEAYTIPTPSMEKSLLVGDFLFVSKFAYGARIPNTPISFPFAHNTMPLFGGNSYLEWIKLGYHRLPAMSEIKNNDVVVFNYPMEDFRPVDKRENYIKRCIAIPGDTLNIINAEVYLNSAKNWKAPKRQEDYLITTDGTPINEKLLRDFDISENRATNMPGVYNLLLTDENVEKLRQLPNVKSVQPNIAQKGYNPETLFPFDPENFPFNIDNYGPIVIPKAGVTVTLSPKNIALYKRIIAVYEGHEFEERDGKFFIDGKESSTYTFGMNYYWMMGDNRHNSADSRYWGFVPEDHIVGKASLIWMSWDTNGAFLNKIRWSRLFNTIKGSPDIK